MSGRKGGGRCSPPPFCIGVKFGAFVIGGEDVYCRQTGKRRVSGARALRSGGLGALFPRSGNGGPSD